MILFKKILLLISSIITLHTYAQQAAISILDSGRITSIRGLSVVDDNVVWASGSNGTIARSTDGGRNFEWSTAAGFEERDFRDIEAFDSNTALIMAVAEPAIILKTKDGGKTWKKVFEDTTKGMFLDAMDFTDKNKMGIVAGDPINNKPFLAVTRDSGESWKKMEEGTVNETFEKGEAFFAASGTNINLIEKDRGNEVHIFLVSGGMRSKFYYDNNADSLPIIQGKESQGANSIDVNPETKEAVITGGDFTNDTSKTNNCVLIKYLGSAKISYSFPQSPPNGYRSCVIYVNTDKLITCGTNGVDISNDGGRNWKFISTQSFHVCQKAKKGNKVFLAGANGKIGILSLNF